MKDCWKQESEHKSYKWYTRTHLTSFLFVNSMEIFCER